MPLYEFQCPNCYARIERVVIGKIPNHPPVCGECNIGIEMDLVEWSVPARRSPEKGIQG
jgi:hypothetical protein